MENSNKLNDLERKLIIIIQNNNKKGYSPTIAELEFRLGHAGTEIKELIQTLMIRKWIIEKDGKWIVINKLF